MMRGVISLNASRLLTSRASAPEHSLVRLEVTRESHQRYRGAEVGLDQLPEPVHSLCLVSDGAENVALQTLADVRHHPVRGRGEGGQVDLAGALARSRAARPVRVVGVDGADVEELHVAVPERGGHDEGRRRVLPAQAAL